MLRIVWRRLGGAVFGGGRIAKSLLTGPDGVSWAPGRLMGLAVFCIGQGIAIRTAQVVLAKGPPVADLVSLLNGIATFEALLCGTAIGLVLGMAPADPGGKWWGRDAAPPQQAASSNP